MATTAKSIDVMIDLETMGTAAGCVILSIGASPFREGLKFYSKIDPAQSRKEGFKEQEDTKIWWGKQSPSAYAEAMSGTKSPKEVLQEFSEYLRSLGGIKSVYVWGNGADFDLPILAEYYRHYDLPIPWFPWNGRCYRTLKNLYPEIQAGLFTGLKHRADEDAAHQARHAVKIIKHHFSLAAVTPALDTASSGSTSRR